MSDEADARHSYFVATPPFNNHFHVTAYCQQSHSWITCLFPRHYRKITSRSSTIRSILRNCEEEKDGIVCLWEGYYGDIRLQTFDIFSNKVIKRVSLGFDHSLFISQKAEVFALGSNSRCQLGLNGLTKTSITTPQVLEIFNGKEITEVTCGKWYSAAVSSSGDVFTWGDSTKDQCGLGRSEIISNPEQVTFRLTEDKCKHGIPMPEEKILIRQVACGETHTLAISCRGELWVWGSGMGLGLGEQTTAPVPERVEDLLEYNVLDVSCGLSHSIALVEKQGAIGTPKKMSSDMRFHKYYPPTCAKCNQEIYSYIETNDLCIISDEHTCCKKPDNKAPITRSEPLKNESLSNSAPCLAKETDSSSAYESSQPTSESTEPSEINSSNGITSGKSQSCNNINKPFVSSQESEEKHTTDLKTGENQSQNGQIVNLTTKDEVIQTSQSEEKSACETKTADSSCPTNSAAECDNKLKPRLTDDTIQATLDNNMENEANGNTIPNSANSEEFQEHSKENNSVQKTVDSSNNTETPVKNSVDPKGDLPEDTDCNNSHSSQPSTTVSMENIVQKSHILDEDEAREFLAKQLCNREDSDTDLGCQHPIKSRLENLLISVPETSVAVVQQVTDLTHRAISTFRSSVGSMADSFGFVSGQSIELDGLSKSSSIDSNLQSDTDSPNLSRRDSVFTYDTSASEDLWRRRSGSTDDILLSERSDSHSSLRALWRRSKRLEKDRQTHKKDEKSVSQCSSIEPLPYFETEVWCWGKNSKGQLGLGDSIERDIPRCVKTLNSKNCTKVVAGSNHCLALTAYSQVFSWGFNAYGQLGHTETPSVPSPVKFVANCLVWDIAAGDNHSLFLTDSGGFHPDVYYSGKQPSENHYSSVTKTSKPVVLNTLRKTGWIRSLQAGGISCGCLVGKSSSGQTATAFELALSERNFYSKLNKIATKFLSPLKTSMFLCAMESSYYKSVFTAHIDAFLDLTNKIGENCVQLTRLIRGNEDITHSRMFQKSKELIEYFKNYSLRFGDMLAINGFEHCTKIGNSYFEKIQNVFTEILDESTSEKMNYASTLQRILQYPLHRPNEYGHMINKLSLGYPSDSEMRSLLNSISIKWDTLKMSSTEEHNIADKTRLFWESSSQKLVDALRTPERRLLYDTKQNPLTQASAGRFFVHNFHLFNDIFVHIHGSAINEFPLETVWVDTSSESEQTQDSLQIITPEETFVLTVTSSASKTEWLIKLNSSINNCYRPRKSTSTSGCSQVEMNRFNPPLVRQAQHKFTKHSTFKDAVYNGAWMKGKLHGFGEMKWPDGRRYIGKFKNGLQHGNGKYIVPKSDSEEIYEGCWKEGKMNGLGSVMYPNGDRYQGYFKDGQKFGHGVLRQGKHMSSVASVYIGEWMADKRNGYGVLDDVLRGEKYMGMWQDDQKHGGGIVVTLDGMYFEGNFVQGKLSGFGLMLTDDDSCYEGEFSGITQLNGKGTLRLPNGDSLEGHFTGSWNVGIKVNATFHKNLPPETVKKADLTYGIHSKTYGTLSVPADRKWEDIFSHCKAMLGYTGEGKPDPAKAWQAVAVMISSGKKSLSDQDYNCSLSKIRLMSCTLDELEKIPPYSEGKMTVEYYHKIASYLSKAFDTKFHPIGKLIDGLVEVFRAAYIGIGAHPRLLLHAVQEIKSYVKKVYRVIRILFPDLPSSSKPVRIYSCNRVPPAEDSELISEQDFMVGDNPDESEVVTPARLLHPLLLPKIYPPLFDLYALYNDKEDEKYWERVWKLNRQGDMALMAYLGIDQKFWLIEDKIFQGNRQKLSEIRDQCYAVAVDMLQQISTAFSPCEKLAVIQRTFLEITKAVQVTLDEDYIWCMDDLFPIFQYVVVRSKIRHLGAEIHLIDDLMEQHLEYGELGIMFTTLKACYFQIQHEKMPG
ncbi:alsin isoform X1 [Octopus bimaculoides]|nr:alsin isoform X1 [Octopus bimaculoides]